MKRWKLTSKTKYNHHKKINKAHLKINPMSFWYKSKNLNVDFMKTLQKIIFICMVNFAYLTLDALEINLMCTWLSVILLKHIF